METGSVVTFKFSLPTHVSVGVFFNTTIIFLKILF